MSPTIPKSILATYRPDADETADPSAALRASERRLRLAMEAARLGSFEWDIVGGRVYWSPAIERMHGIPEGSFEGTFEAYKRDMHPDDEGRVLAEVSESLAKGEAHHLQYRIIRPDGEVRWLEAHGQYEKDDAGTPIRLIGVCSDVTDRVRMEESVRFQQYILRLVTENATSALFMMDDEGRVTYQNAAALAMTGFTAEELRERPLHDLIHHHHTDGSAYPIAECPINRALPAGESLRAHEDVFIRKDGTYFPAVCAISPIIEHGIGIGTVVEVRDVSGEREARDRLRLVTESIPVQVWTARPDGGLDFVTSRVTDYFGVESDALLGEGWVQFVHADDRARAGQRWQDALRSGSTYETEFRLRGKDGSYRWHLARAVPLRDLTGRIVTWFGSNTDIEAQKSAMQESEARAEELTRLAAALERSNRELDQFAYVTSHDLKAPLRGIANLAQWIEEDLGDRITGESQEHMRLLKGRVTRMDALIDGILTYSRAGRGKVMPERVDTSALVRDAVELISAQGVTFEIDPTLPTIVVERVPLQQVFMNLIANAVKFTAAHRDDPVVRVGWRDAGTLVEFWVDDNGPGIAPEFHDRVWGIFQTLNARDKVEGTGIGLSVVKKIVESRGGGVRLTSEPGQGATFSFFLPRTAHATVR